MKKEEKIKNPQNPIKNHLTKLLTPIALLVAQLPSITPAEPPTHFYKYTTWESKTYDYSDDFVRYNTDISFSSKTGFGNVHFDTIPFTDQKINLEKQCWNPKYVKNSVAKSFKDTYASETIFEKKMFLTLDFPASTDVFQIGFNKENGFQESKTVYSEDTKECSFSRYDPKLRITFSICYSVKLRSIYVKRFGKVSISSEKIKIAYERNEFFEEKKKILDKYRMLLIPSGNLKYAHLLIYKIESRELYSMYVSETAVFSKSKHDFKIKINNIQYLCNTLLVISEEIQSSAIGSTKKTKKILNYFIPLTIGESLKGKWPKRFSEGAIKRAYVSKSTKGVIVEAFDLRKVENVKLESESRRWDADKFAKIADELIYARYIFNGENFDLSEFMMVQNPNDEKYFYRSIENYDIVNLENMKIFIVDSKSYSLEEYKEKKSVNSKQYFELINDISKDSTWITMENGEYNAAHIFSSNDDILLFQYFTKNNNFKGITSSGKPLEKVCRMLMRKFYSPKLRIKYKAKNPKSDSEVKKFELEVKLTKDTQGNVINKVLRRYNVEFLDMNEISEKKMKYSIWRGSSIDTLLIHATHIATGSLKNFVRGNLIHQIINFDSYPGYLNSYRNDSLSYTTLFKNDYKAYRHITSYSFLEKFSCKIEIDTNAKKLNIKNLIVFEYDAEPLKSVTVAFLKVDEEQNSIVYNLDRSSTNGTFIFKPIGTIKIGEVKKILPLKMGNSFILDTKGRIFVYDVKTNTLKRIQYTGGHCVDMSFFLHSNLQLTLVCLTDSVTLDFYYVKHLFKNSRTKSMVPNDKESINVYEFLNEKNGKILYSSYYRNKLFVFFPEKKVGEKNTLVVNVGLEGKLKVRIVKKIDLRPPANFSMYLTAVVKDAIVVDDFFVQLLSSDFRTWICVFSFDNLSEEFQKEKCYSIPINLKLLPESKLMLMDSRTTSDTHLNYKRGYIVLLVLDSNSRTYNNLIIDTRTTFLETLPFFLYPIHSKEKFSSFSYIWFNNDYYEISVANFFFEEGVSNKMNTLVELIQHSEPLINLDVNGLQIIDHTNILQVEKRMNLTRNYYYIHYYDKLKLFDKDEFGGYKIKKNFNEIDEVLTSEVKIVQYLPENYFREMEKYKKMFNQKNEILFKSVYNNYLKKHKNFKIKENNKLPLVDIKAYELIKGDIFDINLKLEFNRDLLFNNLEYKRPYSELRPTFKVNSKIIESGIKFRRICLKHDNLRNLQSPCIQNQTLYIDKTSVVGFEKDIVDQKSKLKFDEFETAIKIVGLDPNCTVGEVYKTYFIRICENEYEKKFVIVNFETIQEDTIEIHLNSHSVKHLHIEIRGKALVILAKIRGYIKYFEIYYLEEELISLESDDTNTLKQRKLKLTSLKSYTLNADDFVANFRTEEVSFGFFTMKLEKLYCGFLSCHLLTRCKFFTKFYWYRIVGQKTGKVVNQETGHDFHLDKDVGVSMPKFYLNAKLIRIQETNFSIPQINHFITHFPNSNDFLFYGVHNIFDRMMRIRFSNPFKGLITRNTVPPICKKWLCVFISNFKRNSYIRLYHLDWNFINKLNIREISLPQSGLEYFKSRDPAIAKNDIEDLKDKFTFHTFSVINHTGNIRYLGWHFKNQTDENNLVIDVINNENDVTVYKISKNIQVLANNLYICSKKFSLEVVGREKNVKKIDYEIVEFFEPGYSKYLYHLLWIVLIAAFVFSLSWFLMVNQNIAMDMHYKEQEKVNKEVSMKLMLMKRRKSMKGTFGILRMKSWIERNKLKAKLVRKESYRKRMKRKSIFENITLGFNVNGEEEEEVPEVEEDEDHDKVTRLKGSHTFYNSILPELGEEDEGGDSSSVDVVDSDDSD